MPRQTELRSRKIFENPFLEKLIYPAMPNKRIISYLTIIIVGVVISAILLFVPAVRDFGQTAGGISTLAIFGLWGMPILLGLIINFYISKNEIEKRTLKLLFYPLLFLLVYGLLLTLIEMLTINPFEYRTTPDGVRYNVYQLRAIYVFLGLPFSILVGLIMGGVNIVAARATKFFRKSM